MVRRLPVLLAFGVGVASGAYTIIYLFRWEWNRAMIAALFFVATEVAVAAALVLTHCRRIEDRLDRLDRATRPSSLVGQRIREHGAEPHDHFAWLRSTELNVFLPVLLGVGVFASILGWAVERLARVSAVPVMEQRLARRLVPVLPPAGGLLGDPVPPTESRRSVPRGLLAAAVLSVGVVLAGAGIDYLADRIQTRPDPPGSITAEATIFEVQLRGEVALADPARAIDHLWTTCTGPDVFRDHALPAAAIAAGADGAMRITLPMGLGRHARDRLVGCLNDATLGRVQATVTGVRSD